MKNRLYTRLFLSALSFYLISTAYTRFQNGYIHSPFAFTIIPGLPLDAFPLKYLEFEGYIRTQMSVVSTEEVVEMLKTNTLPRACEGRFLPASDISPQHQDYLVIQFDTIEGQGPFDWKCYLSCLPFSIGIAQHRTDTHGFYENIILPYPGFLKSTSDQPCDITLREKCFF